MANGKEIAIILEKILDNFGAILRYIAPGFWAIVITALIEPARLNVFTPLELVIGAGLLGVLIYCFHICFIVRCLWLPLLVSIHKKIGFTDISKSEKLEAIKGYRKFTFRLTTERWKRRAIEPIEQKDAADDKKRETKKIQHELDKWGSLQSFFYCSAYLLILVPFFLWLTCSDFSISAFIILIVGALALIGALFSDYDHIDFEVWAEKIHKAD